MRLYCSGVIAKNLAYTFPISAFVDRRNGREDTRLSCYGELRRNFPSRSYCCRLSLSSAGSARLNFSTLNRRFLSRRDRTMEIRDSPGGSFVPFSGPHPSPLTCGGVFPTRLLEIANAEPAAPAGHILKIRDGRDPARVFYSGIRGARLRKRRRSWLVAACVNPARLCTSKATPQKRRADARRPRGTPRISNAGVPSRIPRTRKFRLLSSTCSPYSL